MSGDKAEEELETIPSSGLWAGSHSEFSNLQRKMTPALDSS